MDSPISSLRPSRRSVLLGAVTLGSATVVGSGTALAAGPLRRGVRGSAVTDLQSRLTALGYWTGRADGSFGPQVQQAIYALQKAAGLAMDGVVGPRTRTALDAGARPETRIRDGIEIDPGRQLLIVSRGGSIRSIHSTSTGSGKRYGRDKIARTPRGDFSVFRTYSRGWQDAPLGRLYRRAYFTGGCAVHGSTSIPTHPVSHGCARITKGAMTMLWDEGFTRTGTRVLIY